MLFRLGSLRLIKINPRDRMLNFKTLEIPKKVHHTFIKVSSFTSCSTNYKSIKQNEATNLQNNVIATPVNKFLKSPYVRLMRLDRPIGNLN